MPPQKDFPLVSCLMVTGNRKRLAKRAIDCFKWQTYPNKELVIIDDGNEDLSDLLTDLEAHQYQYIRLEKKTTNVLGYLRNLSLSKAKGEFLVQWDDDDWYHPERIQKQVQVLLEGYDACCLSGTLMHLDDPEFFNLPYVGFLPHGVPGSIMHRVDHSIQYLELPKAEDTYYLDQWRKKKYKKLDRSYSHLFIRCFHGSNTWESEHFKRRIRNTIWTGFLFFILKSLNKLELHPRLQLKNNERNSFEMYLSHSKKLALHANG